MSFCVRTTMFSKKKKKPLISTPTNFQHRVHTGYDRREGRYVGLPLQWASIVGNNQILKSTNRPLPLVDPSEITPTEILDLKVITLYSESFITLYLPLLIFQTIVRGETRSNRENGIPRTSHVARSNSLRSSSPTRMRHLASSVRPNVPPAVPEGEVMPSAGIPRNLPQRSDHYRHEQHSMHNSSQV